MGTSVGMSALQLACQDGDQYLLLKVLGATLSFTAQVSQWRKPEDPYLSHQLGWCSINAATTTSLQASSKGT